MDAFFDKINEALDFLYSFIVKIFNVVDELGSLSKEEAAE